MSRKPSATQSRQTVPLALMADKFRRLEIESLYYYVISGDRFSSFRESHISSVNNHDTFGSIMDTPTSSTRDLARRLLAASQTGSDAHASKVVEVIERLRISLSKFAGDAGFVSLLRRAVAMASSEIPSLQNVKIGANGRIDGVDQIDANSGTGALGEAAAVAITAHLLDLLVAFIGEPLTERLLRDSWPNTLISFKNSEADQ